MLSIVHNIKSYNNKLSKILILLFSFFVSVQISYAANLTLSPSSVTTKVGKTFSVDVMVSNNVDNINAVSAALSFPQDTLQVVSLSKKSSIINLWAEEPSFSNQKGTVSIEGVTLNPGFSKSTGKVLSITFKAVQAGNINVSIKSGSVLANDGSATDVLKSSGSMFVYVNEEDDVEKKPVVVATKETVVPVITSPTHQDSNLWYSRRDASFEWKLPEGVNAVRTVYSDKDTENPVKVYDPPITNRSFTVDKDGVYYMAVQFKNAGGWGGVARYKFQVDATAPDALKVSFPDGNSTPNQTPSVSVVSHDELSGITKYTMSIDNGQPVDIVPDPSNLYKLPKQSAGNHTVTINAYDAAGNSSTVSLDFTIQSVTPPVITEYTKKVDFDHKFKVTGATYPNSQVEVLLTDTDGNNFTEISSSSDSGAFTILWGKNLDSGVYEMKVRATNTNGSVSDYTETRVIVVERMLLVRVGIFIMNWLSVVLIVIIAAVCISATLWYALVSFARFRRRVKRNLSEVENTLHANVKALKKDTEEFHDILVKAERKRELTKEETAILKKFKKRLEITEKEIEKKLEQAL